MDKIDEDRWPELAPQYAWLLDELREVLSVQVRELDGLIAALLTVKNGGDDDLEGTAGTVFLMVQAMGVSVHTILKLSSSIDMSMRDCLGIARSVSELAVNTSYITVTGREATDRAHQHALQKTWRDLDREGKVGGFGIKLEATHKPDLDAVIGLREALAEFTDKKGREIRSWTPVGLDDRISQVRDFHYNAAIGLSGSVFSIYRHSSELLHGTVYGVRYFWTDANGRRPGGGQPFANTWFTKHFLQVFSAVFLAMDAVVLVVAKKFEFERFEERQEVIRDHVKELLLKLEVRKDDDQQDLDE